MINGNKLGQLVADRVDDDLDRFSSDRLRESKDSYDNDLSIAKVNLPQMAATGASGT